MATGITQQYTDFTSVSNPTASFGFIGIDLDGDLKMKKSDGNSVTFTTLITETITISSTDILSSNTTPVVVVAAPGSGKFIQLLSVLSIYNGVGYSFSVDPSSLFFDVSNSPVVQNFSNLQSSSIYYNVSAVSTNGSIGNFINTSLKFYTQSADPTTGDGDLVIYLTYQIVTI